MLQPRVALVKANVGRGVEDGDLGCGCGRVLGLVVEAVVVRQWRPWGAEGCPDLLPVGHINQAEIDVLGQARRQIGTRGCAYVENPDPFGVFTAFEQMSNDPPAKKACLKIVFERRGPLAGKSQNLPRRRQYTFSLFSGEGTLSLSGSLRPSPSPLQPPGRPLH